ncbi:MAG TPA: branched-chain amino acid ABC transporter permease [Thermodesulfobacteriota bacterium]|nr:branched-chain amino acid ABC transporter permease [Thermodesulfobacteriota bacterium]
MTFSFFIQVLVNGLMLGLTYVLIASGFSLIYGIMRLLNFAHGEFYMLGAFATYLLCEHLGVHYFTAMALSMVIIGVLGVLVYHFFFRPFRDEHDPSLVIALGIAMLIGGLALIIFGEKDKSVAPVFSGVIQVWGATLSKERVAVIIVAIVLMAALTLYIKFSKTGQAMRAVSQDREAAALQGIGVDSTFTLCMGISSALAGAAGALLAPLFYVNPFLGMHAVLKALVVVVIGGLGSIPGAIVGGLLLGFVESFGNTFFGDITEILGFIIVMIVLLFRPQGLFGHG